MARDYPPLFITCPSVPTLQNNCTFKACKVFGAPPGATVHWQKVANWCMVTGCRPLPARPPAQKTFAGMGADDGFAPVSSNALPIVLGVGFAALAVAIIRGRR